MENLTKGALQEYRGPLFFQYFCKFSSWVSSGSDLLYFARCFNTCDFSLDTYFSSYQSRSQSKFIIAKNVESAGQDQQISAKLSSLSFYMHYYKGNEFVEKSQNAKEVDRVPVKRRQHSEN